MTSNFENYYQDENGTIHKDIPLGTSPCDAFARTNLRLKEEIQRLETRIDGTVSDTAAQIELLEQNLAQETGRTQAQLQETLNDMADTLQAQTAALDSRFDNLITHNNDTEGNSELTDIRLGIDSTVYASAGQAVRGQIQALDTSVAQLSHILGIQWEDGYISRGGGEGTDASRTRTNYIPCHENIRITYMAETDHDNISALTAFDINKHVIAVNANIGPANTAYTFTTPAGTKFIRLSSRKNYQTSVSFSDSLILSNISQNIAEIGTLQTAAAANTAAIASLRTDFDSTLSAAFVSVSGSDSSSGTATAPFATVNKALQSGAGCIILSEGVYEQTIDLRNAVSKTVFIVNGSPTGRVIFRPADSLLTDNETPVSGCTNVYSAVVSAAFAPQNKWIFQDGAADASTFISDSDRLPLQRGNTYRCEDTKLEKCTAQTAADAIAEIENADTYKWFYDSSNAILYFSRPQEVTAQYPLRASFGTTLFSGGSRSISLHMSGIETKYMVCNVTDTSQSHLVDCKSSNVYGDGAFVYNRCIGLTFERCEASRCFSGTNGDGFNAHSNNTGDVRSKQTTVSLIDCWSHDNNDDGYSDHERSETTIIGGLYEYNGKGGVTPSYGSHCNCYNVHSRHNHNGFLYTGTAAAAEGGKFGQLYCNGCVAAYNTAGGTQVGFRVSDSGNSAVLVNCRSIGNKYGYYADSTTHGMRLTDCFTKDNQFPKFGNITVENTTLLD